MNTLLSRAALLFLAIIGFNSVSHAQVDCVGQATVHVSHLKGRVFDPTGVAIPNIEMKLKRGDEVVASTESDENGHFDLNAPAGSYELKVHSAYFQAIPLRVEIGTYFYTIFHPGELRWILAVTSMNCSWATTNATEFNKDIQRFNERLKRDVEKNATQK